MTKESGCRLYEFFVDEVVLDYVDVHDNTITLRYVVDSVPLHFRIHYDSVSFYDSALTGHEHGVQAFAVSLGVIGLSRFAAVLPARVDLTKYSKWIHPEVLTFLEKTFPHWSEHRYQVGRMDYKGAEIHVNREDLGTLVSWPIWQIDSRSSKKVLVASGSGKDSLLCAKLIERAGIDYDLITYLHSLYGETAEQDYIFHRLSQSLAYQKHHTITIQDEYFSWLTDRLQRMRVREQLHAIGIHKPFRTEAGEVLFCAFMFAPVQVVHGLDVTIVGHEKSADAPNLIDEISGEAVAHQWAKSFAGEKAVSSLLKRMFRHVDCVSVTKPLYDVKIFKTLFRLAGDLPYVTNSCNIQKPWCCACEKCAYVFAGFAAFGDHQKTVKAFGKDLFQETHLLPIWRQLLGLEGYIPWECVGLAKEVQLYFYKVYQAGIRGKALEMFHEEILKNWLQDVNIEEYFQQIEEEYSRIYADHHQMPAWLQERILQVLRES